MVNYISMMIAFLITFPFIPSVFVYKVSNKIVHHKLRALHIAIDWTTILYILATLKILNNIFDQQFIGIIFVFMLFLLTIIIIRQWKMNTEVLFNKAIKILWRLCFLIFLFIYIILVIYGIVVRIIF